MKTDDIPTRAPSDWRPMRNEHDLALLGKLGEETAELNSAICRCIIQGLYEREPTTNKLNRDWLEEELGDVLAMITITMRRLYLDFDSIMNRRERKIAFKEPWFDQLSGERK